MTHREDAGDVRRRDDDRVGSFARVDLSMEMTARFPCRVPLFFNLFWSVGFRKFLHDGSDKQKGSSSGYPVEEWTRIEQGYRGVASKVPADVGPTNVTQLQVPLHTPRSHRPERRTLLSAKPGFKLISISLL